MSSKDIVEIIVTAGTVIILILVLGGDTIVYIIRELRRKNNDNK